MICTGCCSNRTHTFNALLENVDQIHVFKLFSFVHSCGIDILYMIVWVDLVVQIHFLL